MKVGIGSIIIMAMMICAILPASVSMQATPPTGDGQTLEWIAHDVYSPMAWGRASLALDNQGKEHIAFWDTALNDLLYVTYDKGLRTSTVVDHSWNTTGEAVVAVDGLGRPHLVYTVMGDPGTTTSILRHAVLIDDIWEVIDVAVGNISWGMGVALDQNDNVHIAYLEYPTWGRADLVYCTNQNGSWVKTVVGHATVPTVSIAIDHHGKVYIAYMAAPDDVLGLATNSSGTWENTIIDSVPTNIGTFSSIAIDPFGKVHISYVDYNPDGELKYATNSTGIWTCEFVDYQANINSPTSMALDSEQWVHVAYYDWYHAELKYATNVNGSWSLSTLTPAGEAGSSPSLALDANDMPHICYVDLSRSTVKCTVLTLPNSSPRLQIDLPTGGETWRIGETHRIQWRSASVGSTVRLDLCLPGMQPEGGVGPVSVLLIEAATDNDGNYDWTVPEVTTGNAYRIMVSDASNNSTFAYSEVFDIKGPKPPEVMGTVCTQLDYPIAGAQMRVDNLETVICDQNGQFRVEMNMGEHDLVFSAEGFYESSKHIQIGNVSLLDLDKINLFVNDSAMHLIMYTHGTDFSLLVPETWELAHDISMAGSRFALVANGSASGPVRTNMNIQVVQDPSAQGTTSYLWNLANDTIQQLSGVGASASIFGRPQFLTIDDHPAMIYSIRYEGSDVIQEQVFVIDERSHVGWILTFTTSQADYSSYKPMFDRIATSLQVSDVSTGSSIEMAGLMTFLGIVAGLGVIAVSSFIRGRAGMKK